MKNSSKTLGIDVGDRFSHVYGLDAGTGEVLREERVRTRREDLAELFAATPVQRIVIETGVHAGWISRLAQSHGHEVVVAQARRLRVIYENPSKSDEVDARMLAELGSTHPELLHPVTMRSEQSQAHLAVVRAREVLVQSRTKLVNSARGLVKTTGQRLPHCTVGAFPRQARKACPRILLPAVRPLLVAIARITRSIRSLDREIRRLCREVYRAETRRLIEVPGIAELTALAFVLTVGDPRRFVRPRDVGAFFGLVPRRDQSGSTDRQLRITKCGDPVVRRLLAQYAQRLLGPFGADCDLRRWGLAKSERGGKNGKRRAVIAVARKIAVTLVVLWKSDVAYEPLRAAPRAAA